MRNHDFERAPNIAHDRRKRKQSSTEKPEPTGVFFHTGLTPELQESLVLYARHSAVAARAAGRAALAEQELEKLQRREERVIQLLNSAVEHYAYALELFDGWMVQRATSAGDIEAALTSKPEAQQLEYIRLQISRCAC